MDWMYEWGNKVQTKSNEEYLLGKEVTSDFIDGSNQLPVQIKEELTNERNENFTLLHEDPLYEIAREELKAKRELFSNPLEMKGLYEQMEELRKKKKKKKSKKSKKCKRSRSRSKERKSSKKSKKIKKASHSESNEKKKSKDSSLYEEYMKRRLGNILTKDEDGTLRPDFGFFKRKFKEHNRELKKKTENSDKARIAKLNEV